MFRKSLTRKFCVLFFAAIFTLGTIAQDNQSSSPKFLGSQSCATSSCHGGASDKSKQYSIWSQRDFHFQRPVATLTTARSERIAEVLKIADPTKSPRCTTCHAPIQTIPDNRKPHDFKIEEGVSCENCHGAAGNWIRAHTRPDYKREDRAAIGMRDLKSLYVRANTCVACHQNVDSDIRAAGHPELIFELDGQSVTEPKHWREKTNWHGGQAWLVGQAVALREMLWQSRNENSTNAILSTRWPDLIWLLNKARVFDANQPDSPALDLRGAHDLGEALQKWSDEFAQNASKISWSEEMTKKVLKALASSSEDFKTDASHRNQFQAGLARSAERLVLGLDRLVADLGWTKNEKISPALDKLFKDAQSLPDFNADQFATDLKEFHARVSEILNSK